MSTDAVSTDAVSTDAPFCKPTYVMCATARKK